MSLGRDWLAAHLPHAGRMSLLESVLEWDASGIVCLCTGHRDPAHPLRAHGRLGIAAGIELAAQAMAAHGALTHEGAVRAPAGMLASLRDVRFETDRLDDVAEDILCRARCVSAAGDGGLYEFALEAGARRLLAGRALVVFGAAPRELP